MEHSPLIIFGLRLYFAIFPGKTWSETAVSLSLCACCVLPSEGIDVKRMVFERRIPHKGETDTFPQKSVPCGILRPSRKGQPDSETLAEILISAKAQAQK